MRTLYIEELAIHDDPKSCGCAREGAAEALTGAAAGWDIEPRNQAIRGADAVIESGRQDRRRRYRETPEDPARSKTLGMQRVSMRENREIQRSPVPVIRGRAAQGRPRPQA